MGTNSDTLIIFDIKGEKKDHLATKEFTLKSLFDGNLFGVILKKFRIEN